MSESNPYAEARREWNDRYLELVGERRRWQAVAGAELVLLVILGLGFVWLSLQHKTIPYVVEVDSLGAALALKPAETGGGLVDERIVRYQLAAFLRRGRIRSPPLHPRQSRPPRMSGVLMGASRLGTRTAAAPTRSRAKSTDSE